MDILSNINSNIIFYVDIFDCCILVWGLTDWKIPSVSFLIYIGGQGWGNSKRLSCPHSVCDVVAKSSGL